MSSNSKTTKISISANNQLTKIFLVKALKQSCLKAKTASLGNTIPEMSNRINKCYT